MRSRARLAVSARPGGGHRIDDLRSVAPIAFRPTRGAVHLIGTAAAPVGDDDTTVEVVVGPGAELEVRSVAATVAWTGRRCGSRATVEVAVAAGGILRWHPEPLVATSGCDHHSLATVALDEGAALVWSERLVVGRHDEAPGSLTNTLRVDVGGVALLRHSLAVGPGAPGWDGPAVLGTHRAVGLLLLAGTAGVAGGDGDGWAAMPLEGPGTLAVAVAPGILALDRAMAEAASHLGIPRATDV